MTPDNRSLWELVEKLPRWDLEWGWMAECADGDYIKRADVLAILERPVVVGEDSPSYHPMRLAVALDFADNPRPYHTLQAPADTNGELYEALRVLAAAYRGLTSGAKEATK